MKIISWNIKADVKSGLVPWEKRKGLLAEIITQAKPDILCLQEAKKHQLDYLLAGYKFIGVGRDDGKERGEFCPILYNPKEFALLEQGTFWLSNTPDQSSAGYDVYPRICTWGKFENISTHKTFNIFNTHLPLFFNFPGKQKALQVVLNKIKAVGDQPVILTGDFNSGPKSKIWKNIEEAGFQAPPQTKRTTHLFTVPMFCFDAIFLNQLATLKSYTLLRTHKKLLYPSDHFGVMAEIL